MFRTILIGVALDARDTFLLDTCVSIAQPLGARRVVLAHVRRHDRFPHHLVGEPEPVSEGSEVHLALDAMAAGLRRRLLGLEILDIHAVGRPAEEILKVAEVERADLLLLGRFASLPHGPETGEDGRDILRHAACTTLVVPEGAPTALGHAVVGVDFSHCALEALVTASRLFTRVTPVYGYHLEVGVSYGGHGHQDACAHLEATVRKHYAEQILPQLPEGAQVNELQVIESERASDTLLQVAATEKADAIVMGGHGQTRLAAILLGGTAERIALRSPRPVLVVRDKEERLGLLGALLHR